MDLVSLIAETWKAKLTVLPVVLLTVLAAAYVVVLRPAEYASGSAIALISPPPAPTGNQHASGAASGKLTPNNPYVAYGNLTVVVDLVQQAITSDAIVDQLRKEGVEDGYSVQPSADDTDPIIDVEGVGASPAAATRATNLLDKQVGTTLNQLQANEDVADTYRITTQLLTAPSKPTRVLSGPLRSLIAIIAAGVIMSFVALSIRRAIDDRRLAKLHDPTAAGTMIALGTPASAASAQFLAPGAPVAREATPRVVGKGRLPASRVPQLPNPDKTRAPKRSARTKPASSPPAGEGKDLSTPPLGGTAAPSRMSPSRLVPRAARPPVDTAILTTTARASSPARTGGASSTPSAKTRAPQSTTPPDDEDRDGAASALPSSTARTRQLPRRQSS